MGEHREERLVGKGYEMTGYARMLLERHDRKRRREAVKVKYGEDRERMEEGEDLEEAINEGREREMGNTSGNEAMKEMCSYEGGYVE